MNMVYMPKLAGARVVKAFHFGVFPDSYGCVLVTDCQSEGPIQYTHVMFVHRGTMLGLACFAVTAEVNKMSKPDSGHSHFLGVFHGSGGPSHENWGGSGKSQSDVVNLAA